MRSYYCRHTVCANREGRCTWLWRGDRIMMSSGNIPASFLNPQILFSSLACDRNQHRPLLWQHSDPIILCSKLSPSFGVCCWLASKCPSYPQASLPSDAALGAVIPAGLAFRNKGCMFSVCLSKEGCITAGLAGKQTETGEPRSNLANSITELPQNIISVQTQLTHMGPVRETWPLHVRRMFLMASDTPKHPTEDSTKLPSKQWNNQQHFF